MDIQNRKAVRRRASEALAANPGTPRKLVLAYIAIITGGILLVAVLSCLLGYRINATSGLGDLGLRAVLSTIQVCLPIALVVLLWLMQLGYQKATVSMARQQAVQPRNLCDGFRFFGPLLRATLLQGIIFMMMDFIVTQVASILFMMTPFYTEYAAAEELVFSNATVLGDTMYTDVESLLQLYQTMIPMICIWLPLFAITAAPFFYSCRMLGYVLLERPGTGALMAMGESGRMMHGNRLALFKYDLGYWWFHLPQFVLKAFLFGSVLVILMGYPQSLTEIAIICGMMAVCLLLLGILNFFFLNRVNTTYAAVYDSLRPQPEESTSSGGAVLGNIFDLARDYKED